MKIQVGSPAAELFLRTPHGIEVPLTACLLEGPVLLEFIRGTWDPDSRRRLDALAAAREAFKARRARVLVVASERAGTAARFLEERPFPGTLLVDEDRRAARSYGVWQRFSLPFWNLARPSSFVIDRCGFVRYAFVARLPIHAADIQEILAVIAGL